MWFIENLTEIMRTGSIKETQKFPCSLIIVKDSAGAIKQQAAVRKSIEDCTYAGLMFSNNGPALNQLVVPFFQFMLCIDVTDENAVSGYTV
ncbi:MAG: hypothetical protein BWY45_02639 [Euryarchaeota archaeon ADurb.Bin294]|nr:MAG: hypothetical protein BWY45_02639 [Euryarchaeota archaeon ADurb.Bin294]